MGPPPHRGPERASREPPAVTAPPPLIDPSWLAARLGHPDLVVLDAGIGAHRHAPARIPGARAFDLDGALSDHASPLPHTLPSPADLQRELRALGVDDRSTVVLYDGAGIYSAPRAWWMLRAMGFDRAAVLDGGRPPPPPPPPPRGTARPAPAPPRGVAPRPPTTRLLLHPPATHTPPPAWCLLPPMGSDRAAVLDGGLPAWQAAGHPVSTDRPAPAPAGDFTARPRPALLADRDAVAAALTDPATAVLDARSRARFTGAAPEPRPHLRPGHLPGSTSLPFTDLLTPDGRHYLPLPALRARLTSATAGRPHLVTTCGSGVTACILAFAAHLTGHPAPAVYDGSWSDWGRPETGLPAATGD
ncbi:sulfurtransferase [Kitasatospora cineracea]|uniref:sulfurtransferase n=1 Tax=Kitasatospora cineracea TaxID=88074 RepID=UPI0036966051